MIGKIWTLPVLALAVSGCVTNLKSVGDAADKPPVGLPYQLPRTQVTATAVWTLDNCPSLTVVTDAAGNVKSIKNEDDAEPRSLPGGTVVFTKGGAGNLASVDDATALMTDALFKPTPAFTQETIGGEFYSIDYEALTKGTKTGSIKVDYHEGTLILKAINAKVDGREGEALKSAFSLAGNVARVGLGLPPQLANKGAKSKTEVLSACNSDTVAFLAQKKTLIAAVRGIEAEAAGLTAKLAVLSAQRLAGMPSAPDVLAQLQSQAFSVQDRLEATKAALDRINRYLSVEAQVLIPFWDGKNYIYSRTLVPEAKDIIALRQRIASDECRSRSDCFDVAKMTATFTIAADLAARKGGTGCDDRTDLECGIPMHEVVRNNQPSKQQRSGLVIRQPVEAVLSLTQDSGTTVLLKRSLMVAQFGLRRTLPLRNGFGENNTLSATFDKAGIPTMIEYTKPRSGAVELLGALDEGAQTLLALQADRRAADVAAAEAEIAVAKKQLETLQRQRDLIKVQTEIDALQSVTPTETEALKAEIATLELLKQIAELRQAIEAAKPPAS